MSRIERPAVLAIVGSLALLIAPHLAIAVDGLPIGVELTNTDSPTLGWVRVADDDGLEPQQFTIEAWITPLGDGYGMTLDDWGAAIIAKPVEQTSGYCIASFYLAWSPDTESVAAFVTHELGVDCDGVTSDVAVPVGTRAHVAVTFDGAWVRLYINGQPDADDDADSPNVDYGDEDVLIGAANWSSGFIRAFQGIVDDVRIWDHARDGATIAADMSCSLDGTEPGLVAYWSFNAGDLRDDSSHGHNGVVEGLVSYVLSNDACLPFASDFETGDLSDWSSSAP